MFRKESGISLTDTEGWNRLRNLEVAVYHSLTSSSHFENHSLPHKADELTDRIAPFFPTSANRQAQSISDIWGQDLEASENRRFCLKQIFETALKLKVQTVLTDEEYAFMLHKIGSVNEPSDEKDGSAGKIVATFNGNLKVILHASLHTYSGSDSDSALVNTTKFHSRRYKEVQQPLYTHSLTSRWIEQSPKDNKPVREGLEKKRS